MNRLTKVMSTAMAVFVPIGLAHAESALPLRSDNLIGLADIFRIALSLIFLLSVTAALLWLYQRRFGKLPPGFMAAMPSLTVVSRLRLSPRTQVFLLQQGQQKILITESGNSATALLLADSATGDSSTASTSEGVQP